jgi:hypothetical protein
VKALFVSFVLFAAASACTRERKAPAAAPVGSVSAPALVPERPLPTPPAETARSERNSSACNEQTAQEFLERAHLNHAPKSAAERAEMLKTRASAIDYRTAQYGYFEGFGNRRDNAKTPAQQSKSTTFFGLPVVMHERVIPALHCVEEQLKLDCGAYNYRPQNLSGLRRKNTYVDGEVSNHVYGIAIDIDPLRNPCCKCLEPWSSSERCRGKKPVWERMAMPQCWVDVFERFGFYWLGHDTLEDTMHFEFLGDPNRIVRTRDTETAQ